MNFVSHPDHSVRAFRTDRVFEKHRGEFLDTAGKDDGFSRGQAAMQFDAEIHIITDRFAHPPDIVDGVPHFGDM